MDKPADQPQPFTITEKEYKDLQAENERYKKVIDNYDIAFKQAKPKTEPINNKKRNFLLEEIKGEN